MLFLTGGFNESLDCCTGMFLANERMLGLCTVSLFKKKKKKRYKFSLGLTADFILFYFF